MIHQLFNLYPHINIVVVDDNSPDKTFDIVSQLIMIYPTLNLLKRNSKLGLASAYLDGFKWALERHFNYIIQMDADFSHNPHDVEKLISHCKLTHADLVLGSRFLETSEDLIQMTFKRLFISKMATYFIKASTQMPYSDLTGGFKCFTRESLLKLDLNDFISEGYIFQFEALYRLRQFNTKILEIPITFKERKKGYSKLTLNIICEALLVTLKLKLQFLAQKNSSKKWKFNT